MKSNEIERDEMKIAIKGKTSHLAAITYPNHVTPLETLSEDHLCSSVYESVLMGSRERDGLVIFRK